MAFFQHSEPQKTVKVGQEEAVSSEEEELPLLLLGSVGSKSEKKSHQC